MNFLDTTGAPRREARLKYMHADFHVLQEGEFVRCAVSGDPILLDSLRYWDVDRQVAYKSAEIAFGVLMKEITSAG
jgi:hypothetical protein